MSQSTAFDMAQALRRSHCDRSGQGHECVGEVTIKRGEVCLKCALCGTGEEIPGWNHGAAEKLSVIFSNAGINWDYLDLHAKTMAVRTFVDLTKGGA